MPYYCNAKIKDGKLFNRSVSHMTDGDYILCLIKQHNGTTRDFQKLYFAQLGEWSYDTGWTKDMLHDLVKSELFVELFKEEISTTDLTQAQWNILISELQSFLILKFENL